jgi:hypothetical protein
MTARSRKRLTIWKFALAGTALLGASAFAAAQMSGHPPMAGGATPGGMHGPMQGATGMPHGMMGIARPGGAPTMPGQDAFGTIQEIVQMLESDPSTDWSNVNIAALREHLIDMNEVTLHAAAEEHPRPDGIEIRITGEGRTLEAIKRMVPAHVHELQMSGWDARTEDLPNGVRLTVSGADARQAVKLRALGFMGIMVQGAHHQMHHLMMAKGEFAH